MAKKKKYICLRDCFYRHPKDDIRPIHYVAGQPKSFSTRPNKMLFLAVTEAEIDVATSDLALLEMSDEWTPVDAVPLLTEAGFDLDVENPPPKEKLVMMISEARTRIEAKKLADSTKVATS